MLHQIDNRYIVGLIADSLINRRLIKKFEKVNKNYSAYRSNNIVAVLHLMGFEYPENFEALDIYLEEANQVQNLHLPVPSRLPYVLIADRIYYKLKKLKEGLCKKEN